ncbi:MAG: aminotransferase class IV [Crocinitomicaceae bacterium]|nr:aminotransferase class IV [Crocinitomicaceae bacterium]
MLYVNNNDIILSAEEFSIHAGSRAYLYGDGVFESIRIMHGVPINLENHIKRLLEGAKAIRMRVPSYYTIDFFAIRIRELCKKSNITMGGYCRLSLDRMPGGKFKPETNDSQFFIEVKPLDSNNFSLNSKGLEVDIYTDLKKQKNTIANFKTKNCLLYILASIKAQEKQLDDLLITNENGGILESSSSNLFVVSNNILYTPGLEEGCLAGTMRMQIINLALRNGIRVYESNITPQNLLIADEILLTNAISGITWVSGYRTKRYFNNISKRLNHLLNDYWEEEVKKLPL